MDAKSLINFDCDYSRVVRRVARFDAQAVKSSLLRIRILIVRYADFSPIDDWLYDSAHGSHRSGRSFSRPILWAAGLTLFLTAFFLPAVRMPPSTAPGGWGPSSRSEDLPGWECAEVTPIFTVRLLQFAIGGQHFPQDAPIWPELPLLAISGWVNPLLLLYLLSGLARKFSKFRELLASFVVLAVSATWIFLAREHFKLLLGHYLWIFGIALTLAAPFVGRRNVAVNGFERHSDSRLKAR